MTEGAPVARFIAKWTNLFGFDAQEGGSPPRASAPIGSGIARRATWDAWRSWIEEFRAVEYVDWKD